MSNQDRQNAPRSISGRGFVRARMSDSAKLCDTSRLASVPPRGLQHRCLSSRRMDLPLTPAGHAARPGIPQAALTTNRWLHVAATYSGNAGLAGGQTVTYLDGQAADIHVGH
mgnify:CR=1 FL=1